MPPMIRFLLALLPFFFFADSEDATDGDEESQDDDDATRDESADEGLGEKGKEALRKERERARAAEKLAKERQDKLDKIEADARKEAAKKAKEQGQWEELANTREAELADTTTKLTAAESELTTLREYVTADLESVAKTVKDAAKDNPAAKILLEFHPGSDAATADLIAWTKRAKSQLPELTKTTVRGNGQDPIPGGETPKAKSPITGASLLN